ncbi:hypothetical protein EV182_006303, partial [Spiromyces aspiralis]
MSPSTALSSTNTLAASWALVKRQPDDKEHGGPLYIYIKYPRDLSIVAKEELDGLYTKLLSARDETTKVQKIITHTFGEPSRPPKGPATSYAKKPAVIFKYEGHVLGQITNVTYDNILNLYTSYRVNGMVKLMRLMLASKEGLGLTEFNM